MLISAFYIWEGSTNTFHLRCRIITPTFFGVVVITSLRPTGDTFDPTLKNKIKPNFYFTYAGFNAYIYYQHDQAEEVSDSEHISFLTLWISHFILCSSSLQLTKKFITLATQIHKGRNACLIKVILGSLYDSLGLASLELKSITNSKETLLIFGHIWLLQLWLSATFEPSLKVTILSDLARHVEDRRVKGIMLALMTLENICLSTKETFIKYLCMT